MDTKEVNLRASQGRGANAESDRDPGDEGNKLLGFAGSDSDVPFLSPARRF